MSHIHRVSDVPKTRWFASLRDARVRAAYLFIAMPCIVIAVFVLAPCLWAIALSFYKSDGITPSIFIGLKNYGKMLDDSVVWISFRNTFYYVAGTVPVSIVLSFYIAVILNEKWFRGRSLMRTIYFLPVVVAMVAVAFVWQWLYNPSFGIINRLMQLVGLPPQIWLGDPWLAMPCIILVSIWKGLGFFVIIYLAGLQGIPSMYYEAASLDGANRWQQIRHVTWPLLFPTTCFLTIMGVIGGFQVFEQVYVMTRGGPVNATRVVLYYLWEKGFVSLELGYASAIAVLLFIVVLGITLLQWKYYTPRMEF